jgi:hypothetical protein
MKKIALLALFSLCSMILLTSPAQAYLDPGSGSMLLQLLLGGVAGAVVILKLYWQRLLHFLGLRKEKEEVSDPTAPPHQLDSETELRLDQRQ